MQLLINDLVGTIEQVHEVGQVLNTLVLFTFHEHAFEDVLSALDLGLNELGVDMALLAAIFLFALFEAGLVDLVLVVLPGLISVRLFNELVVNILQAVQV